MRFLSVRHGWWGAQEKKADKNARPRGVRGEKWGGGRGRSGEFRGLYVGIFTAPLCFNLLEGDENIISLPPSRNSYKLRQFNSNTK